ncbi:MAG: spore maturation protein [Clostridia bacterium]|nr:spore maturation protein [Clostridia bacterium]
MKIIVLISDLIMPIVIVYILAFGYSRKIDVYEAFVEGAKEGFYTVFDILPTLIGLMMAIGILRGSGALDLMTGLFEPLADATGFPKEAVPITFMRLISSSASTGILLDIFKTYGPDSFIGRFVSVMMSCTETVFYTMSVYFMSVKITKTRYTLAGALFANFAGVIAALILCNKIWG